MSGASGEEIRRGRRGDLPDIVEIINHYIEGTHITFDIAPYTVATRTPWFEQFADVGRHQIFVAEDAGRVIGWACSGPWRNKAAYETTAEMGIYLADGEGGKGIGGRLYARLFEALAEEDIHRLVAGITLPNHASVRLHDKAGFTQVGVFHQVGRKFDRYWDVAWYERRM